MMVLLMLMPSLRQHLDKLEEEERDDVASREHIFKDVIGQDGHGRVRMMGVGITPSSVRSESSTANNYEARVQVEIERVQKEFQEREQHLQSEIQQIRAEADQIRLAAEERERLHDDFARLLAEFMNFVNPGNSSCPRN